MGRSSAFSPYGRTRYGGTHFFTRGIVADLRQRPFLNAASASGRTPSIN
jgi:hypothetical protein